MQQEQVIALIQLTHTPDINSAELKLMGILINSNQNLSYSIWFDTDGLKTKARLTKGLQLFSDKPKSDLFKLCYIWILYRNHTKTSDLGEFKFVFIQLQEETK